LGVVITRFQKREFHPTDEDQSLHPSEQSSLAGDPESVGTPVLGRPATRALYEAGQAKTAANRRAFVPQTLTFSA